MKQRVLVRIIHCQTEWILFFQDMFRVEEISFKRCIHPMGVVGDPMLIIFSEVSDVAYGACAYLRRKKDNQRFSTYLILAKGKVAPIKKISVVRLELCGTRIARRLFVFIKQEFRYKLCKNC